MHRIVDISDSPAHLRIDQGCLRVDPTRGVSTRVPLDEVAAIILAHPEITCTHAVLADVAAAGGVIVACDSRRLPVGMQLPLQMHHVQTERLCKSRRHYR